MPSEPLRAVIIGAGHRSVLYASYSKTHPDELQVVGVADPDPVRRRRTAQDWGLALITA
jgi:predicted dehydrogenase